MANNHALIYDAIEVGLGERSSFNSLERPTMFDAELEPVKSNAVVILDGVPYMVTVERAAE